MSRIGKKPVAVPSGVTATVDGQLVKVKGSKGELSFEVPENVSVSHADGAISVMPRDETKRARAMWGMSRSQVANLIHGVTAGYEKKLELVGVGYRASVQGKMLNLTLGFSHPVATPCRKASRSRPRARPRSSSRALTDRKSARSLRTSVATGRRSPTRARASGTPARRSNSRKPRKSRPP